MDILDTINYIKLDDDGRVVAVAGFCKARDLRTRPTPDQTPTDYQRRCPNCEDPENILHGYVELWDGVCPDCGRVVDPKGGGY